MLLTFIVTIFLQVVCFSVLSFLLFEYISKKRSFREISTKLPTLYGFPFLGISYQFLPIKKFLYKIESHFKELKSSTFFTWLGIHPFVITVDPDVIKVILSSEEFLVKARSIYGSIEHALPNGLMTSNGAKWKHDRKLMNLSFSNKIIQNLMPTFNKGALNIVAQLDTLVDLEEHDIFGFIKSNILKTAVETTMGIELKDDNEIDKKLADGFNFILREVAREMIYNNLHLGFLVHTPKYNRTVRFLRDFAANLIKNEYASTKSNNKFCEAQEKEATIHPVFLQQAISNYERGHFGFDDVISETHTVIAGAFDTVTTTIYSIIVLLAMHPHVQEKLHLEISNVITIKEIEIDYEQAKNIPYLDMVIDETLRLMPSIPVVGRQTNRNIKITENIILPKDMQVMIPIFVLHRRKDIWGPNANDFDPNNFLPEKVGKRHAYAYIPFSKGGRGCLGLRYARAALRVYLLTLLRNFKFSTSFKYEDLIFLDSVSLRYDVEPKIKMERRNVIDIK